MLKKFILICYFVLLCTPLYSGVPEHRALAEELIKITDVDTVMDKMKAQVSMVFEQIKAQLGLEETEKPKLDKYSARFETILQEDMAWSKVKEQYVDLYIKFFTESEIKDLIKFYKSDLGQKVTSKMPELMQESMFISQTHMQAVIPKLESLTEEMHKEFAPAVPEDSK